MLYLLFYLQFSLIDLSLTFLFVNSTYQLISGKNGYDFKSVRRWTSQKKLGYGLHECDKVIILKELLNFHLSIIIKIGFYTDLLPYLFFVDFCSYP